MTYVPIIADVGVLALYLLFIWLGSAIAASALSERKGWGDKPGLATGLLLSAVAPIAWLFVPRRPPNLAPGAAGALVTGIVGVLVFVPVAPFAWHSAMKVERMIAESEDHLQGAGMAKAARILGIVGTVLLVLNVIALIGLSASGAI